MVTKAKVNLVDFQVEFILDNKYNFCSDVLTKLILFLTMPRNIVVSQESYFRHDIFP